MLLFLVNISEMEVGNLKLNRSRTRLKTALLAKFDPENLSHITYTPKFSQQIYTDLKNGILNLKISRNPSIGGKVPSLNVMCNTWHQRQSVSPSSLTKERENSEQWMGVSVVCILWRQMIKYMTHEVMAPLSLWLPVSTASIIIIRICRNPPGYIPPA